MMKRTFLLASILTLSFAAAHAADITGSWQITGSVSDNPIKSTCKLTQKDGTLTGECSRGDGKDAAATGTVKDQTVVWHYDSEYNGDKITLTYSGTIGKDGTISGSVNVDPYNVSGDFTAAKD